MTTSSPGCQRVTPGPTFQTTPDASEPPMWWSSAGWERKTETGLPRAAQTLLKLTPAAMTRTTTSNAPGSGTSISSTWKASIGSPSRSWRMTQAAIVAGSSPGSASTCATCVRSTAMHPLPRVVAAAGSAVGARRTLLAVPVQVTRVAQPRPDRDAGDDDAADAPDQERRERVDVPDEPAEVLAEKAGDQRERDEDRRQDGEAGGDLVEAVRGRLQVHIERIGEELAGVGDQVDGQHEVVADVVEGVMGLAGRHAEDALDRVGAGAEHVALGDDHLQEAEEAAPQLGDAPAVGARGVLERALLEADDLALDRAQQREDAFRERVEDAIDDLVVGVRRLRPQGAQRGARRAVDGDHATGAEVHVDLDELGRARAGGIRGAVEDDQQAVVVVVDLRPLAELARVLDRERRQVEQPPELDDLLVRRRLEVEPEELAALAQRADLVGVEAVQDMHPAPRRYPRRRMSTGARTAPRRSRARSPRARRCGPCGGARTRARAARSARPRRAGRRGRRRRPGRRSRPTAPCPAARRRARGPSRACRGRARSA